MRCGWVAVLGYTAPGLSLGAAPAPEESDLGLVRVEHCSQLWHSSEDHLFDF